MSDHDDAVAEGVLLLKTIGLDITYTDEGLEVIVRQIMRLGRAEALTDAADAIAGMRLVKEADHLTAVAARYERGFKDGLGAARDAVTAVQAERGYDAAINWSEIGNEYAEGWTDLLSLILPAIDALRGGS